MSTKLGRRLNLQPMKIERDVEHYSGGNQQKVLLAKGLVRPIKLFIFDEPTVGVDVGSRVAIYEFIREICEGGAAVLLISSDLPEILHLTNRTYVMYRGRLSAELSGANITQGSVLSHFFERRAGMSEQNAVRATGIALQVATAFRSHGRTAVAPDNRHYSFRFALGQFSLQGKSSERCAAINLSRHCRHGADACIVDRRFRSFSRQERCAHLGRQRIDHGERFSRFSRMVPAWRSRPVS